MRIAKEEVFSPVLSIIGFEDEAEAIRLANDTIYGLAAGVWTKDTGRAIRMSSALKGGTVWINTYRMIGYMMPFGGDFCSTASGGLRRRGRAPPI